jgi:chitin synthase
LTLTNDPLLTSLCFLLLCFSGESGSGKTEQFKLAINHLISLSTHKKTTRTQTNVLHAQTIIHAFSGAKTTQHDNASKIALFTEIHFSERGRLAGAKFLPYALEKSRVTAAGQDERNFHVFYNLLAGASEEEKIRLGLSDWSTYQYLSRTNTSRASTLDDLTADNELRTALKTILFQKHRVGQVHQVLAAILHLGNIHFIEDPNNSQDAAIIKNTDSLTIVADLLGVDPNSLMSTLTYKSKLIKRDITTLFLDPEQASKQRDDLVQSLYCLLFSWIVEQINDRLMPKNAHSFIGLLDIPGWVYSRPLGGGFDQLVCHFIQETLHQFMFINIFERDRQEYAEQGIISIPTEGWPTSSTIIDLFVHPSRGLWSIMNAQALRQQQQHRYDDDETLMDNYASANKSTTNEQILTFKKSDTGSKLFSIQHFWGPTTYDPRHFTERNQDYLCNDFIALFCGNAYNTPTTNGLVACLFDDNILGHDDGTRNRVFSQQQAIKPLQTPTVSTTQLSLAAAAAAESTAIPSSSSAHEHKSADVKSTLSTSLQSDVLTISDLLVAGMTDLTHALSATLHWSVLCIRPNDLSLPNSCDVKKVVAQLSHFKLMDIIKRMKSSYYTTVFSIDEFWNRYHVSIPLTINMILDTGLSPREKTLYVAQSLGWNETWMAVGKTKVKTENANAQ